MANRVGGTEARGTGNGVTGNREEMRRNRATYVRRQVEVDRENVGVRGIGSR
jgi:hypothetical protein